MGTLPRIREDLAAPLATPPMLDLVFSAVGMTVPGSAVPVTVGIESSCVGQQQQHSTRKKAVRISRLESV